MDEKVDIANYVTGYIDRFKMQVKETIGGFSGK